MHGSDLPSANGSPQRDSDPRFRLLLDTAHEGIFIANSHSTLDYVNSRLASMLGYSAEEMIGRPLYDFLDEDMADRARANSAARLRGERQQADYRILRKDGRPLWGLVVTNPIYDGPHRLVGTLGMVTDITARRDAEDDLHRSERQFRALAENAEDVISRFDTNLRYLYTNPAIERATGLPPSHYLGKAVGVASATSRMGSFWVHHLTDTLRSGHGVTAEFTHDGPLGPRTYQVRTVPEFEEDGSVGSLLSVARDITEARWTEEVQRFLADAGEMLSASLDYETTVHNITRLAVPRLADFCLLDVLTDNGGLKLVAVYHQDPSRQALMSETRNAYPPAPDADHGIPAVLRSGVSEIDDFSEGCRLLSTAIDSRHRELIRAIGMVSSMVIPMSARGRTMGAMTLVSSESHRKYGAKDLALAEELARRCALALDNATLYREMREMSRAKDEFLAMLGHELRNPLGAIASALRVLNPENGPPPEFASVHGEMEAQVRHMTRLVNDLLDAARITHGRITLRKERVDLRDAVTRALQPLRPMIATRNQAMEVCVPESPVLLNADPVRLHQVIHNLVHNAAKYTQRGGAIRVLVHVQDERAVLCVEDNGVGISAHVLPRIFNVFSQGDRTLDRAEGGIGLGLSLVKSLVDLHGGSVSAASDGPGCGSRFEVCLPLWKASSESARDEPAANSENRRPSPKRVLIVEDNGFAARMLARVVENAGHAVFVAHSGPEAISIASRERPGFVLMDIGLPGWDGYETARRFRADEDLAHATMVALTGYGREEDRQRAFEAGFDHHLVKPVDIDALLTLLS